MRDGKVLFFLSNHPSQLDFDDCSLASVFFYDLRNIISRSRGQKAKHRLFFWITEASLDLNFMREFPEFQNQIQKLEIDGVSVDGCPSGSVSWLTWALNERKRRPSPLFTWLWIAQNREWGPHVVSVLDN